MRRKGGFTLIELLVVIAIIAILAAILFPVFARARAKARQASCNSNVKQCMLAVLMYAHDYDGGFPCRTENGAGGFVYSMQKIQPYIKNAELVNCPEARGGWSANKQPMYNVCWDTWGSGYTGTDGTFTKPAETVFLQEGWSCAPGGTPWLQYWMARDCYGARQCTAYSSASTDLPHNDGSNCAFADGHVKWVNGSQFDTWNKWIQLHNPNK